MRVRLTSGYGRNENEANINCIRNLMEFLLEDEKVQNLFKDCMKKAPGQLNLERQLQPNQSVDQTLGCLNGQPQMHQNDSQIDYSADNCNNKNKSASKQTPSLISNYLNTSTNILVPNNAEKSYYTDYQFTEESQNVITHSHSYISTSSQKIEAKEKPQQLVADQLNITGKYMEDNFKQNIAKHQRNKSMLVSNKEPVSITILPAQNTDNDPARQL